MARNSRDPIIIVPVFVLPDLVRFPPPPCNTTGSPIMSKCLTISNLPVLTTRNTTNIPPPQEKTVAMISKQSDSPHFLPETVSSKTREGLLAMLPPRPPLDGIDHQHEQQQSAPRGRGAEPHEVDHHGKTPLPLPSDFCPSPYTVIIGKGKIPKQNLGNKRLRVLASNFLTQYSEANEKRTKTRVVNEIIGSIRSAGGCFVKQEKNGRWFKVTDQAVREKIGYVFRDLLSDKYRSSSKSKAARRQKEQLGRASFKLERAMEVTYPQLPGIRSSLFSFDTDFGTRFSPTLPKSSSSSSTELCGIVSCEPEEAYSSTLEYLQDDYDVDELLLSPLILPDE
jgi:hypothetical protein